MSAKVFKTAILAGILGLWLPAVGAAQTKTQAAGSPDSNSQTTKSKASKVPAQLPLNELTLVSTSKAAREAVKAAKEKSQDRGTSKSQEPDGSGILELQPAKPDGLAKSTKGDAHQKPQKGHLLKDVHGSVYGATAGSGTTDHTTAGDVGARSRNGKVNVFVGTEHSRTSQPGPQ